MNSRGHAEGAFVRQQFAMAARRPREEVAVLQHLRHALAEPRRRDGVELAGIDQRRDVADHRLVNLRAEGRDVPLRAQLEEIHFVAAFVVDEARPNVELDVLDRVVCVFRAQRREIHPLGQRAVEDHLRQDARQEVEPAVAGVVDDLGQRRQYLAGVQQLHHRSDERLAVEHGVVSPAGFPVGQRHARRIGVECFHRVQEHLLQVGICGVAGRVGGARLEQLAEGAVVRARPFGAEVHVGRDDGVEDDAAQVLGIVAHGVQRQQRAVGHAVQVDRPVIQRVAQCLDIGGVFQAVVGRQVHAFVEQPGAALQRGLLAQPRALLRRQALLKGLQRHRQRFPAHQRRLGMVGAALVEQHHVPVRKRLLTQQPLRIRVDGRAARPALQHEYRIRFGSLAFGRLSFEDGVGQPDRRAVRVGVLLRHDQVTAVDVLALHDAGGQVEHAVGRLDLGASRPARRRRLGSAGEEDERQGDHGQGGQRPQCVISSRTFPSSSRLRRGGATRRRWPHRRPSRCRRWCWRLPPCGGCG